MPGVVIVTSHSLPSLSSLPGEAIAALVGVVVVGFLIRALVPTEEEKQRDMSARQHAAQERELAELVAHRKSLEAELEELERRNAASDRARRLAEAEAGQAAAELKLEELFRERARLRAEVDETWRSELGGSAKNIRPASTVSCPFCPAKDWVSIANLTSGMNLARCHSCANSWGF